MTNNNDALNELDDETLTTVLKWATWDTPEWADSFLGEIKAGEYDAHLKPLFAAIKRRMDATGYVPSNAPLPPSLTQVGYPPGALAGTNGQNAWGVPLSDIRPGAYFHIFRRNGKRSSKWDDTQVQIIWVQNGVAQCKVTKEGPRWRGNGGVGTRVKVPFDMMKTEVAAVNPGQNTSEFSDAEKAHAKALETARQDEFDRQDRVSGAALARAQENIARQERLEAEKVAAALAASIKASPPKRRVQKRGHG